MGYTCCPVAHVHRLEDHKTRVQGDPTEQENHRDRSRQAGNPRSKDLQGQLSKISIIWYRRTVIVNCIVLHNIPRELFLGIHFV